jgi:hypothetical protein
MHQRFESSPPDQSLDHNAPGAAPSGKRRRLITGQLARDVTWFLLIAAIVLPVVSAVISDQGDFAFLSKAYAVTAFVALVSIAFRLGIRYLTGEEPPPITDPRDADILWDGHTVAQRLGYIHARLSREIAAIRKQGNINLLMGVLLAVFALIMLTWFAVTLSHEMSSRTPGSVQSLDWKDLLSLQGLRLSIAILSGGVAFFFLRLYSSSHDSIRYYQNELTNVDSRFTSLAVALTMNEGVVSKILDRLSETERNFILKHGETTVDLERARQEISMASRILNQLEPMLARARTETTSSSSGQ